MTSIISFKEALRFSEDARRRHLLLGNGFSISKFPRIFSYASLFSQADFSGKEHLRKLFTALGSQDFEFAIKTLQNSASVLSLYGSSSGSLHTKLLEDAASLKEILIKTIAQAHPEDPTELTDMEYAACSAFLQNFLRSAQASVAGHVYSLNYDLLLYWTIMQVTEGGTKRVLDINDGFSKPDYSTTDYVVYTGFKTGFYQRIFYLHGALHLFDNDGEIQKVIWKNINAKLIDQTRTALEEDLFPIYVAEGESTQKLSKITHNPYLNSCYEQFKRDMLVGPVDDDAMFIFGHSLAENDDHILKYIFSGKIRHIFISVYGDPKSESNQIFFENYSRLKRRYAPVREPNVHFFDAASAKIWG